MTNLSKTVCNWFPVIASSKSIQNNTNIYYGTQGSIGSVSHNFNYSSNNAQALIIGNQFIGFVRRIKIAANYLGSNDLFFLF